MPALGMAVLCGAVVAAAVPPAPTPLSLDEAIEQALMHNRDLAKGALDVRGYRLAQQEARESVRGFRVVPEGAAGMGPDGEDWRSGLRAEATGPAGTRVALAAAVRSVEVDEADEMRRGEVRVEISQPLFREFGSLVRNEPAVAADETLRAARRAWERDRSALVLRVVELYEGLIYRRRQIERDEELAGRLERLWALADAREQQGRATRTEVMRLDFQRGEADARLETGRARLEIEFQEFANLLGLPLDSAFRLAPPPLLDLDLTDPGRALAVALAERPDYAQALQEIETGDRQLRLARRRLLPDLRLSARQTAYGEGAEWSDAGRLDQEDWFVGLVADVDLNRRGSRLAVARGETDAEGRRQAAEIVRHRLALEVNSAQTGYRRARAELDLARRNRQLAAGRAELARALFEAGRGSADSVSDAESDLSGAELAELAARREASVSAYRLLHVLGTLVPAPRDLLAAELNERTADEN